MKTTYMPFLFLIKFFIVFTFLMFKLAASEFPFLCYFEENLLRSANHVGHIIFCWYTEPVLEQSLVYLLFQYYDISGTSLQPNRLCVSLCGEGEICLPQIPAVDAVWLLHSQTHSVGSWHAATSSCCVLPWRKLHHTCCEKGSSPSSAHRDPSSQNRGSGPSAEVLAGPVYALSSTSMESEENTWSHWIKCSRWPLVIEAERPGTDPCLVFPAHFAGEGVSQQ